MRHPKLTDSETSAHLTDLPGWAIRDESLERTYTFPDEMTAQKFIAEVNMFANELDHHPDIQTSGTGVTVVSTTHDVGGITGLDFQLAQRVEAAAADNDAHPKDGIADTSVDPHTLN